MHHKTCEWLFRAELYSSHVFKNASTVIPVSDTSVRENAACPEIIYEV